MAVTKYYTALTRFQQELDLFKPKDWCSECAEKYRKFVEKTRTYDFLAGLNKELDEVRGRIIETRPQIEEVFAETQREESWGRNMLNELKDSTPAKISALAVENFEQNEGATHREIFGVIIIKGRIVLGTCWQLHGKPPNQNNCGNQRQYGNHQRDTRAYQTNTEPTEQKKKNLSNLNLDKEQLESLFKLLNPETSTCTSLIAQKGNFLSALNCKKIDEASRIIDPRASDHMTVCAHLFSSYIPDPGHCKVRIADGSLSPIARIGTIEINSTLLLKSMYYVPSLSFNLFL